MANRCSSCSKLCALNTEDPEVDFESISVDNRGIAIKASVRLARSSECCGDEVKETTFEPETSLNWSDIPGIEKHYDTKTGEPLSDDHELDIDEGDVNTTERSEGRGRGLKSFYGFEVGYVVRCACDTSEALYEGTFEDDMQASHFEEIN